MRIPSYSILGKHWVTASAPGAKELYKRQMVVTICNAPVDTISAIDVERNMLLPTTNAFKLLNQQINNR